MKKLFAIATVIVTVAAMIFVSIPSERSSSYLASTAPPDLLSNAIQIQSV